MSGANRGTWVSLAGAVVVVAAGLLPWVMAGQATLAAGWETAPGRLAMAIGVVGILALLASVARERPVPGAAVLLSSLTLLGVAVWGLLRAREGGHPGLGVRMAFLGAGLVGVGALLDAVRAAWPAAGELRLRVAVLWRGSILRERIFSAPQRVTVGTELGVTFLVPDEAGVTGRYELIRAGERGALLNLPADATGRLCIDGREDTPAAHARRAGERTLGLGAGDWGLLHAGPLSIFIQQVAPERRPIATPLASLDSHALASAATSALVHVGLIVATLFLWTESADVRRRMATFKTLQVEVVYEEEREEEEEKERPDRRHDRRSEKPGGGSPEPEDPFADLERMEAMWPIEPSRHAPPRAAPTRQQGSLVDLLKGSRNGTSPLAQVIGNVAGVRDRLALAFEGTGDALAVTGGGNAFGFRGRGRGGHGDGDFLKISDGFGDGDGDGLAPARIRPKPPHRVGRVRLTGNLNSAGGCQRGDIVRTVRRASSAIRACYEQRLALHPTLSGRLTARWTIGADGRVTSAQPAGGSLTDATLTACVLRAVRRLRFPRPEGALCVVQWPFVFESGH